MGLVVDMEDEQCLLRTAGKSERKRLFGIPTRKQDNRLLTYLGRGLGATVSMQEPCDVLVTTVRDFRNFQKVDDFFTTLIKY